MDIYSTHEVLIFPAQPAMIGFLYLGVGYLFPTLPHVSKVVYHSSNKLLTKTKVLQFVAVGKFKQVGWMLNEPVECP